MLEQFDEKTRRSKIRRLILAPAFGSVVGAIILYLKLHDILETIIGSLMLALGFFLQQWNWVNGKRFGVFSGDRIGPSAEEEFDDAVRKMKETGEKL